MKWIQDKGIAHMDLATRNILLTHPDELAKIADFGLARNINNNEPSSRVGKCSFFTPKFLFMRNLSIQEL